MQKFNTGESNDELREKYNPDGSLLRKAQMRMYDMLLYLDKVCKEQNIIYCLDGGNVLGAVRHGGFIPWDDDVDIILDRKNYNKLCKFLKENPHPQYVLQDNNTDPNFFSFWSVLRDTKSEYLQESRVHNIRKFRGLQIDIFPLEKGCLPLLHIAAAKINYYNHRIFVGRYNVVARFIYLFQKNIINTFFRCIDKLFGNANVYTYAYGTPFHWKYPEYVIFPCNLIKFENHFFSSPTDVEEFLKIHYGNYMDLPEPNNRNKHKADYSIWD